MDEVHEGGCLDNYDLKIDISDVDYKGVFPMLWFGIGVTPVGSQISTVIYHLPNLASITIEDKEGEIRIILKSWIIYNI